MTRYQAQAAQTNADSLIITAPGGRIFPALPGRSLLASFADKKDTLLFITHDILHEEQLDISLLRHGKLLDRLSLGQMFQPGDLGEISQSSARHFTFTFPSDQGWQLEVFATPRLSLPHFGSGVSRLRFWRSYFNLVRSKSL